MSNPHYLRARKQEQDWVNNKRKLAGVLWAFRAAGSKSGPGGPDVVAITDEVIYLWQLKAGKTKKKWKEYAQLLALDGKLVRISSGIE